MHKIIVTDIFGKTPELEALTSLIGRQIEIIDPYSGKYKNFADESEAYSSFMNITSIKEYCKILKTRLDSISTETQLIGFSVGASVLWRLSDDLNSEFINQIICFYGSQIRHDQNINPTIHVELVLPEFESTFDVDKFAQNMSKKANVIIHKTKFLHGFMNACSKNFNPTGYKYYSEWLANLVPQ